MASGFCVSMLLLSLTTLGQLAAGTVSRYGGRNLGPYSAQAETQPRSYRPLPSSYESSVRPRGSVASSKFPGSLPAEASKSWGSVPTQGQSGYSRQVNSYSQPGSVSSYRSASALAPQQGPRSLLQRKPGMREQSPQGEKRYGSSVVSSGAIEMRAPPQPQSNLPGTAVLQPKEGMWNSVGLHNAKSPVSASRPSSQHPAFSAPAVLQTKEGMWDSVRLPSAKSPVSASRPSSQHPAFSAPAVLQTKEGMWDSVRLPSAKSPVSASRPSSQHPAFSAPAVLQTKEGMWDSVRLPSAKSPVSASRPSSQHPAFSAPAVLQTKEGMWDSVRLPSAKSPVSASRPSSQHPAFSAPAVLQTKEGMWDSVRLPSAKSPEPAARRPHQNPTFSAPAVAQNKADMWRSVYSPSAQSPDTTPRRHQHSLSVPALLQASPDQLNIYTSSVQAPESTAQRHKRPSVFSSPTVLQNKHMWGSMSSPDPSKRVAANPRSSRPVAPGYYTRGLQSGTHATQQQARLPARQPQLGSPASSVLQSKDFRANPQIKLDPRSSRPVNTASRYRGGSWQPQLSYNRN